MRAAGAVTELRDAVEGRVIERLGRRGKYLVWELADEVFLLVHLRMTGTLLLDPAPGVLYRRVRFVLSGGHELAFCDPRRFGTGQLVLGAEALDAFFATRRRARAARAGADGRRACAALAKGRRAPIKAFLLDQRRVAGVGNIYADEALFRARVHPLRPAGQPQARAVRASSRARCRRCWPPGIDARWRFDRRLPPSRRRPGCVPERLPGAPAPRRAVRPLRQRDREIRRRGARDLRL